MTEVRALGAADADRLRDLRLRALSDAPEAFASTAREEAALPTDRWFELAERSEHADAIVIFVAVDGERWVGMAAGQWHDRGQGIAQLWGMWVEPAMRGRRIGERLVAAVRAWAADHGGRFVRVGVVTAEGDPTPFYERLGFVGTGEGKPLPRDPARRAHFLARPV
ncbi:MAG: GNAT family N-acetyltransferase [Solirubrobacteraceae bacterium]